MDGELFLKEDWMVKNEKLGWILGVIVSYKSKKYKIK